ncbi:family 2 glycosyl transferase, partial [Klebsiella oxytoca]
ALLVTAGIYIFYMLEEVTVKIVVDIVLFFISYWIQNSYIFRAKG